MNVFYPELTARDSSLNLLANQLSRLQVGESLPFGVGLRAETQLIIVTYLLYNGTRYFAKDTN